MVLQNETPERVPVLMTTGFIAIKHSPYSPIEVREDGKKLAEAQIRFQKTINADSVSIYYDVNYIPEGFGCKIRFTRFGPVVYKTLDIYENMYFEETASVKAIENAVEYASNFSRKPVMPLFEGPFTTATRIFEAEKLLRAIYLDPSRVKEIMETLTITLIEFSEILIKKGADILYIPDPSSTPDMISPSHSLEFSFPYLKKLIKYVRKHVPVIIHMCGDTESIWSYIPDLRGNAYSLDQKISLKKAREKMKDIVLAGNIDPIETLLFGSPERVREESIRAIEDGGPEKFILMPGCAIPSETPLQNLKKMVEVAKSWRLFKC
jgi:MtaA/CmuA family methyltransferase